MKKKIIITVVVLIAAAAAVCAVFFPKNSFLTKTPLKEVEMAFENESYDELYDILYSGKEDEPSKEQFIEGFKAITGDNGLFDFSEGMTTRVTDGIYEISDKHGNTLRLTKQENEKYKMEVVKLTKASYTVHAPKGSTVKLGDKVLEYSEASDCYIITSIDAGTYTLTVEKDGCKAFTKEVTVSTDNTSENSIEIDLELKESYLEEYKKQAETTLRQLLNTCAEEKGDLSEFNFLSDYEKMKIENAVEKIVFDLGVNGYDGDYTTSKIKIDNLRFTEFTGDALSKHNENSGRLIANFQYEYSYSWQYFDDSGKKSDTGEAMITMEKVDSVWYLTSAHFTLRKTLY